MAMKANVKKHITDTYNILSGVIKFCEEKQKEGGGSESLGLIIPNIVPTMTFITLLHDGYDELNSEKKFAEDIFYEDIGFQVIWQIKSAFLGTLSIIEHSVSNIINSSEGSVLRSSMSKIKLLDLFKEIFDIQKLEDTLAVIEKEKFALFMKCLKGEAPVKTFRELLHQSMKVGFITNEEKKDWEFLMDVRNSITHNNAVPKKSITHVIYGKTYSFEEEKMMEGKFEAFALFTKRLVEIFYTWVQKHEASSA